MKIRSHYRQLGPDEVIRRGDLWQTVYGSLVGRVRVSIGRTPRTHSLSYTYWRRRHVAVNMVPKPVEPRKQHPIEKNPLVQFDYPKSGEPVWAHPYHREVRVIGANGKYLVGIQMNGEKGKRGFKKFLKVKMTNFRLVEFSPESVS